MRFYDTGILVLSKAEERSPMSDNKAQYQKKNSESIMIS